ncbi:glycosyltransferase [Paraburkholderia sp. CNPSo 3274]|uniref:glycosyltransferase n=1 Tax=Paraburkholderia sp. CNPSo 3274 TaxID=2940932 RepID=UPI0020B877E6|nr:glycosyltransferase [Paraburkholderia sp. CNPSo 3274]MCP3712519.1 glycosyltransferase [Paraburkholderia sp. CNPSo 3274]
MIGIVIPAHNEECLLAPCLRAALTAARHPALLGEHVHVLVVLDACTDGSATVARGAGVETLAIDACNVGAARAAGASRMLEQGARWLAFSDADSRVAPDWLYAQQVLKADAVCGPVAVDDWSRHPARTLDAWRACYHDADGHRHVHGANLGVCACAYRRAGGFSTLACGEDVALVEMLRATGAVVAWSAAPRVVTSARLDARVRGGFGDTLAAWARDESQDEAQDGEAPAVAAPD